MVLLKTMVEKLDKELNTKAFGPDPGFSRFIPAVYDPIGFDWRAIFEKEFTTLCNGLMIKGDSDIGKVFLAVFPTDYVLETFIENGKAGDLLFMHHPLLMECGDPRGKWGCGFVPIKEDFIQEIKRKKLSVYTCHEPLDYHKQLGTNVAIAKALDADIVDGFLPNEFGKNLILVCDIPKENTNSLIEALKKVFHIPYADFEGQRLSDIERIAIIAGCGDKVDWMKEAERNGIQAYITGEIHCHIDNEYGKQKYNEMMEYAANTSMSLIGVSHAASEFLVMKTLMKDWFEYEFSIETVLIPQEKWWL